ncbi:MAG TPA: recombination mediator RecR [Dehalococcoidia bacterium]|jgi:recombination protein RecR|nr:recombination mediator RecR [Dehalococcoidia bacterium]
MESINNKIIPKPIRNLILAFSSLPGVGPKTAQRLTYFVTQKSSEEIETLSQALTSVKQNIVFCEICFYIMENTDTKNSRLCLICEGDRNKNEICIVENPLDVIVIENSGIYDGLYHVLHGAISPMNGLGPNNLKIESLMKRITNDIHEIIFATNPTMEGEATAMYIQELLSELKTKPTITMLARGLPTGADLEYSDFSTLSHAFENRSSFN